MLEKLLYGNKMNTVSPEEALPGREAEMPVPDRHDVLGTPLQPPFPEGLEQAVVRPRAASGAPSACSGSSTGVYTTAVGLRRRLHAEPDVRGGVHRPHRAHRGRARRLRPQADLLRGAAEGVLGGPRPDPGHAPGQRRRHPVPLGHLLRAPTSSATAAEASRERYQAALTRGRLRRDHDRDRRGAGRSTTPRTTTSSTSRRSPTATAASAAPACPARWGWGRRPRKFRGVPRPPPSSPADRGTQSGWRRTGERTSSSPAPVRMPPPTRRSRSCAIAGPPATTASAPAWSPTSRARRASSSSSSRCAGRCGSGTTPRRACRRCA